jgi:hypothetical protein
MSTYPAPKKDDSMGDDLKIILDSIKDFKTDMDKKLDTLGTKLDDNVKSTGEQATKIAVLGAKQDTTEKNITKLWDEIDSIRIGQAEVNTKIETHLSGEKTEKDVKKTNFNWINLLTPLLVTIGLAIIGIIIGGKK